MARRNDSSGDGPTRSREVVPINIGQSRDRQVNDSLSWQPEGPSVDPRRLYVNATDEAGHSGWIKVRVQPRLRDAIAFITSPNSPFGFRTFSEFVRDASVHRIAFLIAEYGKDGHQAWFDDFAYEQEFLEQIGRARREQEFIRAAIDRVDQIVAEYAERGQYSIAHRQLAQWSRTIDEAQADFTEEEKPHLAYVGAYLHGKMAELRKKLAKLS